MRSVNWLTKLTFILATALAFAVGAAFLPDEPYMRYATLDRTIQSRVRWIYERIYYDATPVDVAVIGPSRSEAAVSAPRLASDLARAGYPLNVVNFSLPENGRDLNWVIVKELFKTKSPKLIIVGVIEKPSRLGHPAYKYIARSSDIVDPAYMGNLNYLSNLVYLPYRQLRLFVANFFPRQFELPERFDHTQYAGTLDDTTISHRTGDGTTVERARRVSAFELRAGVIRYERGVRPPLLGVSGADFEFGDERVYLSRIVALAHHHRTNVVFLFLPYYTGPSALQERDFYATLAPVLDASFVKRHDEWYSDVAHLNHIGAQALTDWLATRISSPTEKYLR
jgi:hypothetical protein